MPIYLGADKLDGIHLGAGEISKVYLGQTLVYQKGSGPTPPSAGVLFDHGWVSGVSWQGNYLPRPQYTSIAGYNFAEVDTQGHMILTVDSQINYSNVNQNCHVCVPAKVTVPAGATKMRVTAHPLTYPGEFYYKASYLIFGLLTEDCVNAMDATNGGQLSGVIEVTSNNTYDLTLASGIAGNSWVPVVNMRRSAYANINGKLYIEKVWFE